MLSLGAGPLGLGLSGAWGAVAFNCRRFNDLTLRQKEHLVAVTTTALMFVEKSEKPYCLQSLA
jgi:hypothetical protein